MSINSASYSDQYTTTATAANIPWEWREYGMNSTYRRGNEKSRRVVDTTAGNLTYMLSSPNTSDTHYERAMAGWDRALDGRQESNTLADKALKLVDRAIVLIEKQQKQISFLLWQNGSGDMWDSRRSGFRDQKTYQYGAMPEVENWSNRETMYA